ncbi:MAG: HU family DNA-binding protein [Dysgonamonadaceae bacterium]|jgi:DNA-binding protein HU-beta|nr:HU family DNA-binding protein [Dysgonamonadaceae bacterium]
MTKKELVIKASEKSGLTQTEIFRCITPFLGAILEALHSNETIIIRNFGTFYVKEYPAREARNPSTGETIIAPPKKVVKFRITPKLKSFIGKENCEAVNNFITSSFYIKNDET